MVDQILDKLGIYDLIGVLLPGTISSALLLVVDELVFQIGMHNYFHTDNTIIFLVISYFIGVILQELGSILMRIYDKGHKTLNWALKTSENKRDALSGKEWELVTDYVKSEFPDDTKMSKSFIYDYCKHTGGNSIGADKDQSIAAMSRSMAVFFMLLSFSLFIVVICTATINIISLPIVSLFLSVLLGYRSFRFYRIRYVRIIRNFCFKKLNNKSKL